MASLMWPKRRLHLASCEYCGKRIAWSPRKRQWLSLAPLMPSPTMTQLGRRLMCPTAPKGAFHDPAVAS
jgi:hypothetical protein